MALRGNLKDFSLPDVFQLVTFSRKTGVLRIKREDGAEGSVWFRDGDVFFAQSNWHAEPLGERLVRAQRVTEQALGKALEMRREEGEDGRRLGTILVDEGYITEKVLESFVQDQIQDTIFDLMRWDEGDFDFEAMPDVVEEDIGLTVSIENIVMEGSRRLEEWTRIKKKIPSMDVVFKMATAPGEGTFEISLKPMEWQLLLLVDSTRSVADLANETGRTDFEVARIIYGLFSAGLLEFATDEEVEHSRAERSEREAKLAEIERQRRAELEQRQAAEAKRAEEAAAKVRAEEEAAKAAAEAQAAEAAAREQALKAQAEEEAAKVDAAEQAAKARTEEEARTAEAAQAVALQAAEAETPVAQPKRKPAEEPSFLGGGASGQSADDEAVLEAFMGAVLEKPAKPAAEKPSAAAEVAEETVAPEPPAAPYVPVEEPAFMAVEHEETVLPGMAVPSVEDIIPDLAVSQPVPTPGIESVSTPQESEPEPQPLDLKSAQADVLGAFPDILLPAHESGPSASAVPAEPETAEGVSAFDLGLPDLPVETEPAELEMRAETEPPAAIEPPAATEPAAETETAAAVEPQAPEANSFESDLRSLGLGELPSDLLGFEREEPAATPEPPASIPVFEEPSGPEAEDAEEPFELLPVSEPMSSLGESEISYIEYEPQGGEDEPEDEIARLQADLSLPSEIPAGQPVEIADEEPDFSALLMSLDVDSDVEVVSPEVQGFDEELLREEPVETGGVISTDAFLEDIGDMDMGGSLNAELSALTGLNRPARPQASVNKIPEAGSAVLRRDTRVDKETLLKIIDGIQSL